jgi:acyl carrier protein
VAAPADRLAPRNPVEEVLAGMWCELLELEEVGVRERFFDLGGHSLLATQLVSWVADAFDAELDLRQVFAEPTIEALAADLLADPARAPRIARTAELLLEWTEEEPPEDTP